MDRAQSVPRDDVDAVMLAAQGLVAVIAASFAAVEEQVTVPQWRVLVLAREHATLTLPMVAAELGVHSSNATRICDRLVVAGFLDRRENPGDRRQVHLRLTQQGRDLLALVLGHRRTSVEAVLTRMGPAERASVADAMLSFGRSAQDVLAGQPAARAWP